MIAELPAPGPSRTVPLPHARERRLNNGLRVIAFSRAEVPANVRVPLVTASLTVERGSANDPVPLSGLAAMTATMMMQGTRRRSALEMGAAIDSVGARLASAASFDASTTSASATTSTFETTLELLAETVREPAFDGAEFERVRAKALSDLQLTYSSASALARLVFARAIGGESPYAHPIAGTQKSLGAMTRDDVVGFHAHAYRPDDAILLIGGEIDTGAAFALAEGVFGDWRPAAGPDHRPRDAEPPAPRPRVVAIDRPEAGRTALCIGRLAVARASEAYYAGIVTCGSLAGYSGRLNQEVRVKRGLSYGAGAQIVARGRGGSFTAATLVEHAEAVHAVEVVQETLHSLVERPPADAELSARKATMLGAWNRAIDTNEGLLGLLGDYALYGIPLDELERYTARVEAIDPAQIAAFASTYVVPDTCTVLVGDTSQFVDSLANIVTPSSVEGQLRVIPSNDLDLDHAI